MPALLATAWLLLLPASANPWSALPGDPASPGVAQTLQVHAWVHGHGLLGVTHSRMLHHPNGLDWVPLVGVPVDALVSRPLAAVLGLPAALTALAVLGLWAAGAAMAWLAGRWWGSLRAALVAGIAYQTGAALLFELAAGRPGAVLGAALVPLALGGLARALAGGGPWLAAAAGAAAGLAALCDGLFGGLLLVGGGVLALLALRDGLRPWAALGAGGLVAGLLAGPPAAYAALAAGGWVGAEPGTWEVVVDGGEARPWVGLLADRGLVGVGRALSTPRPLVLALVGLALWTAPRRRWLAPVAWIVAGGLLALGPWADLPGGLRLPGPARVWVDWSRAGPLAWPGRAWLLAAPGLALLVGGAVAALERRPALAAPARRWGLAAGLSGLLAAEALVVLPQLPVPTTPAAVSSAALALEGQTVAALVLPFVGGPRRAGGSPLVDQLYHGRPLAAGPRFPLDSFQPAAAHVGVAASALQALAACELPAAVSDASADDVVAGLRRAGLREVHVELTAVHARGEGEPYLACVGALLGDRHADGHTFRVYSLGAAD